LFTVGVVFVLLKFIINVITLSFEVASREQVNQSKVKFAPKTQRGSRGIALLIRDFGASSG
jgi:hypothetical protein